MIFFFLHILEQEVLLAVTGQKPHSVWVKGIHATHSATAMSPVKLCENAYRLSENGKSTLAESAQG